jgi:signal transduction histidine kinase
MGSADGGASRRRRATGSKEGGAELSRHPLRTPLLAIRGTAELLLAGAGGPLGATARELLAASGEAALRLERLVEPLLRVAERAGEPPRRREPVEPVALLRAAGIEVAATHGRRIRDPDGRRGMVVLRGGGARLVELLELARAVLGTPLVAELSYGARSGAVFVTLEGRGPPSSSEDERPLLLGLAGRLARLAGARLSAGEATRLGVLLPSAGRSAAETRRGERRERCVRCGIGATFRP